MGILALQYKPKHIWFLGAALDLKALINRNLFQLDQGLHNNQKLQALWKADKDGFVFTVLDRLEYDEEEANQDYLEELNELLKMWQDRLAMEKQLQIFLLK